MASRFDSRLDFRNISFLFIAIFLYVIFSFSYPQRYLDDPSFSTLPTVAFGTLAIGLSGGVALAISSAVRIHEALEKNGEYMYTRKMVLYIILSITVVLSILGYFATTSAENGYLIVNSLLTLAVVTYAVGLVYDFHWEMKHQKIIMVHSPYRLYAVRK